jgi:hypothetical protein
VGHPARESRGSRSSSSCAGAPDNFRLPFLSVTTVFISQQLRDN